MVKGLDRFKEHFAGYADRYVLIGGTPPKRRVQPPKRRQTGPAS